MNGRNLILEKKAMRERLSRKRKELSEQQRKAWSEAASACAAALVERLEAEAFMVYTSFREELDLSGLAEWGWSTGRRVIAPRCEPSDRSVKLYILTDWSQLMRGAYGIMEPDPAKAIELESGEFPKLVFVPGLAFDLAGGRLGYGGGYYDRFAELAQKHVEPEVIKWYGVAFEAQLIDKVPTEAHDLSMDGIVTEHRIYNIDR